MAAELKTIEKMSRYLFRGLIVGFLLGVIAVAGIRFATYKHHAVHHHANFALYINGQRDEFNSFTFYEEVQSCNADDENNVKARAHMHDQNNHLVHVHANGVTWSQFFTNLGYVLGDRVIQTDKDTYVDDDGQNELKFTLNGQEVGDVASRVIKSEDVLLINYGRDDGQTLNKRFDEIPRDASEANTKSDPAACRGDHPASFSTRLKKALIIWE